MASGTDIPLHSYIKAYGREKEAALERIVLQPYGNQAAKPEGVSAATAAAGGGPGD